METIKNLFGDLDKYMLYLQEALNSNNIYRIDRMYMKIDTLACLLYNGKKSLRKP